MDFNSGIYMIVSPTNKKYVGQSFNLEQRFNDYKIGRCKEQPKLYESLYKYGFINHTFSILEYCDKSELNNRERYWQEYHNVLSESGLNLMLEQCDSYKRKLSKETKNKISKALKGRPPVNRKKIVCIKTKELYNNIKECSIKNNLNYSTLKRTIANKSNKKYKYYEII